MDTDYDLPQSNSFKLWWWATMQHNFSHRIGTHQANYIRNNHQSAWDVASWAKCGTRLNITSCHSHLHRLHIYTYSIITRWLVPSGPQTLSTFSILLYPRVPLRARCKAEGLSHVEFLMEDATSDILPWLSQQSPFPKHLGFHQYVPHAPWCRIQ